MKNMTSIENGFTYDVCQRIFKDSLIPEMSL